MMICRIHRLIVLLGLCIVCANEVNGLEIPERWLERASGYEEGRLIQQELGVDMVVFIANRMPAGPARRSRQVENDLLRRPAMREFLADYVKVKLVAPTDAETNTLVEESFRVNFGPRLFVVRPGGFMMQVGLFDRDGNRRSLRSIEDIQNRILSAGTPRPTAP